MNTEQPPNSLAAIISEIRGARNAASDITLVPTDWLTQWADRINAWLLVWLSDAAKEAQANRARDGARLCAGIKPELNLTIKREWLDTILYRGRREEYRAADNRQCLRLWRECESVRHFPLRPIVAVLRAGYSMDSFSAAVLVSYIAGREGVKNQAYDGALVRYVHAPVQEWGEPREPHFALGLERVLRAGPYADVRAWLATPDAGRAVAVARVEGAAK